MKPRLLPKQEAEARKPGEDLVGQLVARAMKAPAKEFAAIRKAVHDGTKHMVWAPNPGPQTDAYLSQAEIILYGGQAGGGKSHLELGWGVNEAEAGIIFRRELSQTDGLERDGRRVIGNAASFNGTDHEWTWPDGRTLKLGGIKNPDDWIDHAGRERDYMAWDEAGEFLEVQVASLFAWLRARPGKRVRAILASNPPRTADGYWLIEWFAPWLDEHHPDPADPGELRYAIYVTQRDGTGRTVWVDGPGEYEVDGERYTARSRTFIPASLEDNPFRNTPEYRAQLQNLPEPLRSQLLYGDFTAGMKDGANQTMPTSWVREAMARWTERPPDGIPMCSIGVDCTGGGDDPMVLACRHDGWYAPMVEVPGAEIPKERAGAHSAGIVLGHRKDGATVVVDMGGGYGGPLYEHLAANDIDPVAYKGSAKTNKRTRDGKLTFTNVRSAAYWAFREALDPEQPGGSPIALPSNKRLMAGLCAPTYEVTPHGIQVEAKSKREGGKKGVVERLGFSPDEADAVVMAWFHGPRAASATLDWISRREHKVGGMRGMQPQVITGKRFQARRR